MSLPPSAARPWAQAPAAALAAVHGVFTDIDDTLTRDGAIDPPALAALQALHEAGVPVIAITGRPLGWSRELASRWPLRAIAAENGAVALLREGGGWREAYAQDEATRAANAPRLRAAAARLLHEVPGARLARDSAGRVTDIAIDHSEFTHLPPSAIAQAVRVMHEEGMHASVSSIHINGWYGGHDKWSGACWMLQALAGRELPDEVDRWIYVGDSTNDQAMFARFALSVGVANLRRFAAELHTWPAYLTHGERGAGFAEVAQRVLACRPGAPGR
ncbi:HAD-IIB family hydrolase [Aquincola sp. MAHUQ-54]|uniref:HAD-IIB family hydrolase n=1 Tax=Aquincola agrisoli TaxID=3119538 RepID=A0AAW9QFR8_9BURK